MYYTIELAPTELPENILPTNVPNAKNTIYKIFSMTNGTTIYFKPTSCNHVFKNDFTVLPVIQKDFKTKGVPVNIVCKECQKQLYCLNDPNILKKMSIESAITHGF